MIKLDGDFLASVGLARLPAAVRNEFLAFVHETLQMRVGMRVSSRLSGAELETFQELMEADDEPGALRWLEETAPDYREIVRAELKAIGDEIRAGAAAILAAEGVH